MVKGDHGQTRDFSINFDHASHTLQPSTKLITHTHTHTHTPPAPP